MNINANNINIIIKQNSNSKNSINSEYIINEIIKPKN